VLVGQRAELDQLVALGAHVLEVRAPGMKPRRVQLDVGRGGIVQRVKLEPVAVEPPKPPALPNDRGLLEPGSVPR
jgi:hypothetical protein